MVDVTDINIETSRCAEKEIKKLFSPPLLLRFVRETHLGPLFDANEKLISTYLPVGVN